MIELSLSLSPRKCKHIGCNGTATMFGVCKKHEPRDIIRHFVNAINKGVTHPTPPSCFDTVSAWRQYVVATTIAVVNSSNTRAIDYCKDCTPKYKQEMMTKGMCSHAETVFIRSDNHSGDLIGVSITGEGKTGAWEKAVMGMSGPIVALPPASVIEQQLTAINTPKKRGPKPKAKP